MLGHGFAIPLVATRRRRASTSSPSVIWDQTSLDHTNAHNASITLSNFSTYSVYRLKISCSNGGVVLAQTDFIPTNGQITGLDTTTMLDGTLTVSLTLYTTQPDMPVALGYAASSAITATIAKDTLSIITTLAPLRAWLPTGYTGSDVDMGTLSGAFGTSTSLTPASANEPQISGKKAVNEGTMFDVQRSGSQRADFTAVSTTDFHLFMPMAFKSTGTANQCIIGKAAASPYINLNNSTTWSIRAAGVAAVTLTAMGTAVGNDMDSWEFAVTGGAVTIARNEVEVVASTATNQVGAWTFDKMFSLNNGNFLDAYVGPILLFGSVLTGNNLTYVRRALRQFVSYHKYVSTSGSDSNLGWSTSAPWSTVSKTNSWAPFSKSVDFIFNDDESWTTGFGPTVAGTSSYPKTWRRRFNGTARPKFNNATVVSPGSSWSAISSSVQTYTLGASYTPGKVWVIDGSGNVVHIFSRATSSNYSFTASGTTLTVRYDGVTDLNTLTVYIAANAASTDGFLSGVAYTHAYGLDIRHFAGSGTTLGVGSAVPNNITDCYIAYNKSDGCDVSNLAILNAKLNAIIGNGQNIVSPGSDGDGLSAHGSSQLNATGNYITGNLNSGVRSEVGITQTIDRNWFYNNIREFKIADQDSLSDFTGTTTLTNNVYEYYPDPDGGVTVCIDVNALPVTSGAVTTTIYGNTIVSRSAGVGTGVSVGLSSCTMNGNIIRGFATGSTVAATITLTEDYNNYYGNTANKAGSGTHSGGTHDITTDPQHIDFSGRNYRITAGSGADGTANNNSLTLDFRSKARDTSPAMGAYEP